MLLKEFYTTVISSEVVCVNFLRNNGLMGEVDANDPCHKCGTEMVEKRRKSRAGEWVPVLRCTKKGCQTTRSVRNESIFHMTDLNDRVNSKLTLCQIMELLFFFVLEMPIAKTAELTGRAESTVTTWFEMCRNVCTSDLATRQKMVGTDDDPIQIDESRFAGHRKYHRGRMLTGDAAPGSEDEEAQVQNMRNHGARVDGPWVFGLRQGRDCRYFVVERRDKATLIPLIKRECEEGSLIHSDEWPAYKCLPAEGFRHETVNHQVNYVDPTSGAHTQGIERSWLDAKVEILRKKRGVPLYLLQGHLDFYCWQHKRKSDGDLFLSFLDTIRATSI